MSLGKFEEDNLLEFREKALLRYSANNEDSENYNIFNRIGSAVSNTLSRIRGNRPTPIQSNIGRSATRAVVTGATGPNPAGRVQPTTSSSSGRRSVPTRTSTSPTSSRRSSSTTRGASPSSTSRSSVSRQTRQQQPTETAAQREARLQREREEAERRERERREAEERLRQQREATEAARRERLRSITRDVAQRIIENALVNANRGQSDTDSQLCQRPDGSIYGIAKGQSCVSGEPISQRPENDRTQEINEAARNDPNQQNLPVGWRTTRPDTPSSSSSSSGSTTPPPAPAPVPAEPRPASADRRISGNTNEASA